MRGVAGYDVDRHLKFVYISAVPPDPLGGRQRERRGDSENRDLLVLGLFAVPSDSLGEEESSRGCCAGDCWIRRFLMHMKVLALCR